ncbi:MAG: alpha-mannosidase, partial [Acidimicrobiaceae bacterium]|nr:alpha-mannosidase [Acidimicrobiaceae bacterium]
MHDDRVSIEDRVSRMLETRIRPARHRHRSVCAVRAWSAPGRSTPPAEAIAASYAPLETGSPWGAPWQTTWLEISAEVPATWAGGRVELLVDLGFSAHSPGFQAEGLAYDRDGRILKGIAPKNNWLLVSRSARPGEAVLVYVEAAANPTIMGSDDLPMPTLLGDPSTAGDAPLYRFEGAELVLVDEEVAGLVLDVEVLDGLMRELSVEGPRRHEILRSLERALDLLDPSDVASGATAARAELAGMLARRATASAHRMSAVGHAHIDSAWLWPLAETVRKCARTFANVIDLMEEHPELVFACSQAQQYQWMKEHYPALFEKIREQVKAGRWVPVGGMWVEADTNLPGGEALVRQLVYGQRFFAQEFGTTCEEVWLPDCFGYSGALPQLVRLAGARYFLTQKISWNQTNRFPHHSFYWEGIDGSAVFAHFPPVDTYNAELMPAELAHAVRTYAEHGRGTRSLVPFGYGDGGGGPTREMLGRASRLADLEGAPRLAIESPAAFFHAAEAEYPDAPRWSGEIYLELHRGTYTSQAGIKRGNRACEHLLREAELWSATAAIAGGFDYAYDEIESLWKTVLLNQFHDIIPGSSIAEVNREAVASYAEVAERLEVLVGRAQRHLAGNGETELSFNAAPHPRDGVQALGAGRRAPAGGVPATARSREGGGYVLDNGEIRVELDRDGLLVSLVDHLAERELVAPGRVGNVLQQHRDLPNRWDAWDVDSFYRNVREDLVAAEALELVEHGPDEVSVKITRAFGASRVSEVVSLQRGAKCLLFDFVVDWEEEERFLKLAFPFDVQASSSVAEIQFGHVERPTHTNTSWEAAS